MELEAMKKLVNRYRIKHRDIIRESKLAERYYKKQNDILKHGVKMPGEAGNPLHNADNRIPSNFYNILVNQKASYLFAAPPMFDVGNKEGNKKITKILGDDFSRICKKLCISASNSVIGWLHYWVDENRNFQYAVIDSKQVIPIWAKGDLQEKLIGVMRAYDWIDEDGTVLNVYEYWDNSRCWAFAKKNRSGIHALSEYSILSYLPQDLPDSPDQTNTISHGFGEVPFIPFFNNAEGGNDLKDIKELVDVYDKVYSGYLNDLEDIQEIIFVLSGYEGEDLKEFLHNLKKYKTIKLDENGDGKGGLNTLTIDIPVEAREKMLTITRKSIFEQGMGIDPDPQNFGNSSGVALSYLYSLLELKAGLMETEFRSGFNRLIRAICRYLGIEPDSIIQTWTRTSVRNDSELSVIAQQSAGVISRRTILEHHPWVDDADKELEQLEKEELEEQAKFEEQQGYNPFQQPGKAGNQPGKFPPKKEGDSGEGEEV